MPKSLSFTDALVELAQRVTFPNEQLGRDVVQALRKGPEKPTEPEPTEPEQTADPVDVDPVDAASTEPAKTRKGS